MTDGLAVQDLRFSDREIERLSGLEVSDRWIGGMIGGVYRFSQLRHPVDWLGWLLLEGISLSLLFMMTLPIGLMILRWGSGSTAAMLGGMAAATLLAAVGWTVYRVKRAKSLQTFMHLLDDIDRYHAVLDAAVVLEELRSIRQRDAVSPPPALEPFQVTRDCLVAGLKTERILRGQLGRRSQSEVALEQLEHNLVTLKALSLQGQADDYSTLLSQALQIGQSVQEELVKSFESTRINL